MKKIAIYGAGQIGTQVMTYLLTTCKTEAEVIMFSPHNFKRIEGAYEDLKDAVALTNQNTILHFKPTNNIVDLAQSDIVFFCAGIFPKPEEYEQALQKGIDDRLLQAVKNTEILDAFCLAVNQVCPKAKIFIITNPVDLMTEIARKKLPDAEVYGLGCYLDTARFKREFAEIMQQNGTNLRIEDIHAWILGHHSGTMFLHQADFTFKGQELYQHQNLNNLMMQALTKTRQRGLFITKLNCASQTQKLNNGAYFAPAMMVFNIIKAFLENQTILLPLNRTFYPQDNFNCEGAAQLLCKIQNGNIYPVFLQNTPEDIKNMQDSLAEYEIGKKALAEYIK